MNVESVRPAVDVESLPTHCRGCGHLLLNPNIENDGLCSVPPSRNCYHAFALFTERILSKPYKVAEHVVEDDGSKSSMYFVDWSDESSQVCWDAWCDSGQPTVDEILHLLKSRGHRDDF